MEKLVKDLSISSNYDTQSTFDFQNLLKLDYTPTEDDIIQKIEITLPQRDIIQKMWKVCHLVVL